MTRTKHLSLGIPKSPSPISSTLTSPTDPGSAPSSPSRPTTTSLSGSPRRLPLDHFSKLHTSALHSQHDQPSSPELTSLPPFPASPRETSKFNQESSKGFFSNLKASKSSNKVHSTAEPTIRQVSEEISRSKLDLSDGSIYSRPSPGSTPDLSLSNFDSLDTPEATGPTPPDSRASHRPGVPSLLSNESVGKAAIESGSGKKTKPRFGNLISRTKSTRLEDIGMAEVGNGGKNLGRKAKPNTPIITNNGPQAQMRVDGLQGHGTPANTPLTPKTAPLPQDRHLREGGSPELRNRSAERGREDVPPLPDSRTIQIGPMPLGSTQLRDGSGTNILNNLRDKSSRAAGGLNKAGKGIMAKMNRGGGSGSGGTPSTHVPEEGYVYRVIKLPLVEQTRATRIAARLEDSKDKTEFWMPALPWRCIDYLNFCGCEVEGIYRVPGSGKEVGAWMRRFDKEGDIDLFGERDLYDINTVASLFKLWLRELPTEILPQAVQERVHKAHPDATEVPQMFKDELSMLPPWNYYLLFAITCHLSLLSAYSDKNKMNYANLVICFQPALRLDVFCFQFLVQKWRDCWQGCWTEKEALEEEYRALDLLQSVKRPPGSSGSNPTVGPSLRNTQGRHTPPVQGSNSQPLVPTAARSQQHRPPPLAIATAPADLDSGAGASHHHNGHTRSGSHLPELEPMQPLSPIVSDDD